MRRWVLVILVFAATRAIAGYVTDHPDLYPDGSADATFDVANYTVWANQIQDFGNVPYRDFDVEYPPGSVALAQPAYALNHENVRTRFVLQTIVLDAIGLAAMCVLARRRDQWWGVVAWLALLPLLGPVAYSRLDMAVAVCLAWAFERLERGRWTTAGAWLGLGASIKLTPALLLPAVVLSAPKRWRPAAAAGAVGLLFFLPFLFDVGALFDDVVGYHNDRGVHVESLWGSLTLLASVVGDVSVDLVSAFGATDVESSFSDGLRTLSNVAAAGVLLDSALSALLRVRRGDGEHTVLVAAGTLVLLTGVGRVYSPQYLVWLVPCLAVGLTIAPRRMRPAAALLTLAVVLAHVLYPIAFYDYLDAETWAVTLGVVRNLAILGAGVLMVRVAWRFRSGVPAVEEHEAVEAVEADVGVGPDR